MILSRRRLLAVAAGLPLGGAIRTKRDEQEIGMTGMRVPGLESFDATMKAFMKKRDVPGGSLAVVKDGRLVYARGYGLADRETRTAVQPTTLFRIASISKPVTGVAVLKLVQEGRLALDDKAFAHLDLKPHLESGANPDPRLPNITVRHLLHHTGGFDRGKSSDPMFQPLEIAKTVGTPPPADPNAIIRYMMGRPLDFDPGAHYAYSNFGYCVLGRIIERVTGMRYEAYVQKELLSPFGITRMKLGHSLLAGRARGETRYYQPNAGKTKCVFPESELAEVEWPYGGFNLEAMDAHGGWIASAVDLVRFAAQLDAPHSRPLLKPETARELYAPPAPPVSRDAEGKLTATYYACGWSVRPVGSEGKANLWHTGSLPGTATLLVRRWDGLTWAALFNQRSEGDMPSDGEIDSALHKAADAVKQWPDHDLFSRSDRA